MGIKKVLENVGYIALAPIIVPLGFYYAIKDIFNSKSRINMAVVGMSGAGKTTLFDAIRNENRAKHGETGMDGDKLLEKELKIGEKTIVISETVDYDGNPSAATNYESLFKKSDIIIFVFDASEYEKNIVDGKGQSYRERFIGQLNNAYYSSKQKERKVVLLLGSHKDKMGSKPDGMKKDILSLMQKNDIDTRYFKLVFGNITNKLWVKHFMNDNIFKYAK